MTYSIRNMPDLWDGIFYAVETTNGDVKFFVGCGTGLQHRTDGRRIYQNFILGEGDDEAAGIV